MTTTSKIPDARGDEPEEPRPGSEPTAEQEHHPGIGRRVEDIFRKALFSGVGALFMTEEGIRGLVGELKLPREIASFVITQTEKTKREVVAAVAREMGRAMERTDLPRELRKMLTGIGVEVTAQFRFVDLTGEEAAASGRARGPRVKARVAIVGKEK